MNTNLGTTITLAILSQGEQPLNQKRANYKWEEGFWGESGTLWGAMRYTLELLEFITNIVRFHCNYFEVVVKDKAHFSKADIR